MNKFTAIILLTVFLTAQYARQVSYLECKLSTSLNTGIQQCDCKKLIKEKKNLADPSPIPVRHNHFHPDDLYDTYQKLIRQIYSQSSIIYCFAPPVMVMKGKSGAVDHPPQIG